jgi:uncharacterized protein YggE
MGKTVFVLSILLCSILGIFAQSVRPSVSVVGEADMSISPDQVVFTFEVVTSDKEVIAAKVANDQRVARTLAAARGFDISGDDVQTDSLTISPKYTGAKDPRGEHILVGYEVTKRILITLKDLNKIDGFLSKVIEAGVNRVVAISIENGQMQKYQEQVRAMAVRNAQNKALAYARQLGQTVGKAYVIREEDADLPTFDSRVGIGDGNGDGVGSGGWEEEKPTAFGREITFALGKIKVEEKIYVTFELNR